MCCRISSPCVLALAAEPGLESVQVQRLARGVALSGEVDSPVAEDRALRLAAASLPEGVPVENNLNVGLDLGPLRSVVAGDAELSGIRVERTGRGVALIGEVGSAEASEQASRLAAALSTRRVCRSRTAFAWCWISGLCVRCLLVRRSWIASRCRGSRGALR